MGVGSALMRGLVAAAVLLGCDDPGGRSDRDEATDTEPRVLADATPPPDGSTDTDPPPLDVADQGPSGDAASDASADAGEAADAETNACPPYEPGPPGPAGEPTLDRLIDQPPVPTPGAVGAEQLALIEHPGGLPDLAVVRGGRVEVLRAAGPTRWRSEAFGASAIVTVTDLNGDGRLEVLARAQRQLRVFDALTGAVRWTLPAQPFGDATPVTGLQRILVADVERDARPWLLVTDAACGGSDGTALTAIFRFPEGDRDADGLFDGVEALAVRAPLTRCGQSFTLADVDGDERVELVQPGQGELRAVDLVTGEVRACGPIAGLASGLLPTWAVALRADGPAESLLVHVGAEVARVDVDPATPAPVCGPTAVSWQVRWRVPLGTVVRPEAMALQDLNEDGTLDVLVSGLDRTGDDQWRTFALDGETGAPLFTAQDQVLLGAVTLGGTQRLLVRSGPRPVLERFGPVSLATASAQGLETLWTADDAAVLLLRRDAATGVGTTNLRRALTHADQVLLLGRSDLTQVVDRLRAFDGAGNERTLAVGGEPGTLDGQCAENGDCVLAAALPDGTLGLYDPDLVLANPGAEVDTPSAQAPAGAATLLALPETDGPGVVGVLPGGDLARLDPAVLPTPFLWRVPLGSGTGSTRPVLLRGLGGGSRVVRRDFRETGAVTLSAFDVQTGARLWSDALAFETTTDLGQQWPVEIDGDGVEDLLRFDFQAVPNAACRTGSENERQVRALSGADGRVLWSWRRAPSIACGGVASERLSVVDGDADGRPEVYVTETDALVRLDLETGVETDRVLIDPLPSAPRGGGLVVATGRAEAPLLRHGGNGPIEARALDLALLWRADDALSSGPRAWLDRPALVVDETVWIAPGAGTPAVRLALATGALLDSVGVLDGASVEGPPAATFQSFQWVPNPTEGVPFGVLATTEEAALYAFDPTGALLWTRQLEAPPRPPVVADLDADGVVELLLATTDGQITFSDDQAPPPSAEAWDLPCPAPLSCGPEDDIDLTSERARLCAAWRRAPGEADYEARAVGADGAALTPWRDVGAETHVTLEGLELTAGARYCVEVRARPRVVGSSRVSPPVRTDCVLVVDDTPPTIRLDVQDTALSRVDRPTALVATMNDDRALAAWSIQVFGPGGLLVVSIARGQASGTEYVVQRTWDGTDGRMKPVPSARYRIVASVQDETGATAFDAVEVEVCDTEMCP